MNYEPYYSEETSEKNTAPLLLSVVLHGALLAALFFFKAPSPKDAAVGIETTLIGTEELLAIEGQIKENAKLAAQGDAGQDQSSTNAPSQVSPAIAQMSEDLARRQAEFDAQMAKFAEELDNLALAEQQAIIDELKAEKEQNQAELSQARKAFANYDNKVKENQKGLDAARQARDDAIAEAERAQRKQGGTSGSLSSDDSTANESAGTGAKTTQGAASGVNKNAIIQALQAIIYRNWQVPSNASGEQLQAVIRVDNQGHVLGVSVSGGNAALKNSLENAIRNSSPLSPVKDTGFTELKVTFYAK